MRLPARCRHTTLAISCWHCLLLARASAERASLPVISHFGVKLFSVGWGAPSTLPVSPCWKMASWASPRSSVRFLWLEESGAAGSLRPGLCLAVTALTTLDTSAPGLSGRPRHRPCFRLALPRRPAELSESLEPSLLSGNLAFFCRSCASSRWMQKRGQTALSRACFPPALPTGSPEHPCSQSSMLPVPTELSAATWQVLWEQPLHSEGHHTAPPPPKAPG